MDSLTQLPLFPLDKTCSHCNRALPYDSFRPDGKRKDGYFSWCRQCERDWKRTHRPAPHPEISERRCHDCGLFKPLTDFYCQRNCVAGRSYRCKACSSMRSQRWHLQHREQEIKRMRRWYRDNEEAVRAYNAAHLSEHAASARTYYQRHRVRIREDRLKADRTYRQKHREEINHRRRLRYRLNPEPVLARSRRYYALRAAAPGSHTTAEWQDLQALYGYRCLRCGRQDRRLTPDHVVPLSRGGSDDIDNIQPLCLPCNIGKHARTIDYRPAASS